MSTAVEDRSLLAVIAPLSFVIALPGFASDRGSLHGASVEAAE